MKRNGLFAVIALALGTAGVMPIAHAQDTGGSRYSNWYIVPRIGAVYADSSRQVKTDWIAGVGVGYWINPHWSLDAEFTGEDPSFKSSSMRSGKEWETLSLALAVRWYFTSPDSKWRPYVMGGGGFWRHAAVSGEMAEAGGPWGNVAPSDGSGWGPGATLGVGVLYSVNDRIAIRGEIASRWYRDTQSAQLIGVATGNNGQPFPSVNPGTPVLSHTYGPKQWLDTLGTIAVVINMGHPAPPPPPAAPPPPPVAPPPPPPQNVVIDLRGVEFKFDRPRTGEKNIGPTLKAPMADSIAILDQAIDTLNRYPQVQIEIDGHTDSIGTEQYNQGLSERRAHIVADYLTSHGIDASRITAIKGFGETQPIATNKTAEGRQRNRRVEFKVEGQGVMQQQ